MRVSRYIYSLSFNREDIVNLIYLRVLPGAWKKAAETGSYRVVTRVAHLLYSVCFVDTFEVHHLNNYCGDQRNGNCKEEGSN